LVISTPNALHLKYILAAVDAGIPFYVEKPVVSSLADMDMVETRLSQHEFPINMVGCNLRQLPALLCLHQIVRSGKLGNIVRADFEAGQWLPDWRPTQDYRSSYSSKKELGGGVLFDLIHEVDAALWFFGEFNTVNALSGHVSRLDIESDDCACLLLGRNNGPYATIRVDYVSRVPVRRYTITGDEATATLDFRAHALTISSEHGVYPVDLDPDAFDISRTYKQAMYEMVSAIRDRRQTQQPIQEGFKALKVVLTALNQS